MKIINYFLLKKIQIYFLHFKNLISYLDLKWEEECLKFYNNPRIVKTASSLQVRQKIYRGSSRKWLNYSQFLNKLEKELGH